MIALLSIDVGKACGVLSSHGLEPELVNAAMANAHRVEARAEAVKQMASAMLAWRDTYLAATPYLLRTPPRRGRRRAVAERTRAMFDEPRAPEDAPARPRKRPANARLAPAGFLPYRENPTGRPRHAGGDPGRLLRPTVTPDAARGPGALFLARPRRRNPRTSFANQRRRRAPAPPAPSVKLVVKERPAPSRRRAARG